MDALNTKQNEKKIIKNGKKYILYISTILLFAVIVYYFQLGRSISRSQTLKLIPFKSGDKWGYIDKEGKILINPQFNKAWVFIDGIALILSSDNKYGYIDEDGKFKINPTYKDALPFSEGLACVVSENSKPQFIDINGNVKFVVNESEICGSFYEGLSIVKIGDKFGYLDNTGKMKINPQFDAAYSFNDGLAAVGSYNKDTHEMLYGFINTNGDIAINYQFKGCNGLFSEGLASVYDGKKFGFIDKSGKFVINPQFNNAGNFKNSKATIKQGSMVGYINKEGKIIINPQFISGFDFSKDNDLALVWSSDRKAGYIDSDGKYIINPQFETGTNFYGDFALVRSANKWGIINKEGKYISNPMYDEINVDFDNYKNSVVYSDYFDVDEVVKKFLSGTDQTSFRGINSKSTFSQIANQVGGQEKLSYIEYTGEMFSTQIEQLSSEVSIVRVEFAFPRIVIDKKAINRSVMRYDYWKGNYQAEELDHYENVYDQNAHIYEINYHLSFNGKANSKSNQIFQKIYDEIATNFGIEKKTMDDNQSVMNLRNDEFEFSLDSKQGIIKITILKNAILATD